MKSTPRNRHERAVVRRSIARFVAFLFLGLGLLGCAARAPGAGANTAPAETTAPGEAAPSLVLAPSGYERSSIIPVGDDDAVWGSRGAPVTIVAFMDFQCRFCGEAFTTVRTLADEYGGDQLRVVFKHHPLPFHPRAMPAALASEAVLEVGGADAFLTYATELFAHRTALSDDNLRLWAAQLELDVEKVEQHARGRRAAAKIARHVELAERLGASGTPAFRVNGRTIHGAQPIIKFRQVIDDELRAAGDLVRQGVPSGAVYNRRVQANFSPTPEPGAASRPTVDENVRQFVPVGDSPALGPADAPVTIVAFLDFQCPYCARGLTTMKKLLELYPADVRVVFKHNPLAFHPRAVPAALLAIEARSQQGEPGFWTATDKLFAGDLEPSGLLAIANDLGLTTWKVKRALARSTHDDIEEDVALAWDVRATSTPHFFVNGHRLAGAKPLEAFTERVVEELAEAEKLGRAGVSRAHLYEQLTKDARRPDPPERRAIGSAPASAPSRGNRNAPVVIQMFQDFQCPFCGHVVPTLEALEKEFPGKIRFVWRNYPLGFHHDARPAAAAALEAKAQRGDAAFWKMHDRIFEHRENGMKEDQLVAHGQAIGLNVQRFRAALADGRHDAAIDRDLAVAAQLSVNGTPAFFVNDFFLSGAQPLPAFRKLVHLALREAKTKKP